MLILIRTELSIFLYPRMRRPWFGVGVADRRRPQSARSFEWVQPETPGFADVLLHICTLFSSFSVLKIIHFSRGNWVCVADFSGRDGSRSIDRSSIADRLRERRSGRKNEILQHALLRSVLCFVARSFVRAYHVRMQNFRVHVTRRTKKEFDQNQVSGIQPLTAFFSSSVS